MEHEKSTAYQSVAKALERDIEAQYSALSQTGLLQHLPLVYPFRERCLEEGSKFAVLQERVNVFRVLGLVKKAMRKKYLIVNDQPAQGLVQVYEWSNAPCNRHSNLFAEGAVSAGSAPTHESIIIPDLRPVVA